MVVVVDGEPGAAAVAAAGAVAWEEEVRSVAADLAAAMAAAREEVDSAAAELAGA